MAEQITFTGAVLKSFSRSSEGGRALFESNLTEDINDALGWGTIQPWEMKATLEGELHAKLMTLQPADGKLKAHQISVDISLVNNFVGVRQAIKGTKNKGVVHKLNFTVDFADPKGCQFLEEFLTHAGGGCTLEVQYVKQQKLGLNPETP